MVEESCVGREEADISFLKGCFISIFFLNKLHNITDAKIRVRRLTPTNAEHSNHPMSSVQGIQAESLPGEQDTV